jgi:RNA polymerase sigma factor (TIGR02999 family)
MTPPRFSANSWQTSPIDSQQDVIQLLSQSDVAGEEHSKRLFAALYDELHRLAERQLRRDGGDLSLGPTTLLHEAYLDLAKRAGTQFPDRARFMAYAARAMRALIIDYVRRSRAEKRGGYASVITLTASETSLPVSNRPDMEELTKLSDALDELATLDEQLARLVDLHFFCGFSLAEIAEHRGVSVRTLQRDWQKARLVLHRLVTE